MPLPITASDLRRMWEFSDFAEMSGDMAAADRIRDAWEKRLDEISGLGFLELGEVDEALSLAAYLATFETRRLIERAMTVAGVAQLVAIRKALAGCVVEPGPFGLADEDALPRSILEKALRALSALRVL